ncbi:hypothetical protein VNI00_013224 [Paramarasmius palmivorus]|uniref:Beta-xylanase n=1 Tax=Paramarasmius palmivorus TaxID=297713 RepID=A0AAW0C1T2_9AGAR
MTHLRFLIFLAISASTSFAQSATNTAAQVAGKLYFGSATDNSELTDAPYVAILNDTTLFGQITPANSLKWDATEPERGVFTFSGGDAIVNLARGNGQLIRGVLTFSLSIKPCISDCGVIAGHNTVWHNQLPSWVSDGNFDAETLTSILQTHVSTVMGRYQGEIWDVVNEPFNEDGTFQSFVFFDTLGESYIDIALNTARVADPNAKLYINEFNIEGSGAKSTGMFNLVQDLKQRGIPIDGIGIQAHLIVGEVPSDLQANFEHFASLGVEIAVTELDIRMTLPATDELLEQQRQDYQTVVAACNAVEACVGVTIWDSLNEAFLFLDTDKFSWIPGAFPGQGAACPWDENLEKKPAFDGIIAGFA